MDFSNLDLSTVIPDDVLNWLLVVSSIVLFGAVTFLLGWTYNLRRKTRRAAGYHLARVFVLFGWVAVIAQALAVAQGVLIAVDRIATIDWRVAIFLAQEVTIFVGIGICYHELRQLE